MDGRKKKDEKRDDMTFLCTWDIPLCCSVILYEYSWDNKLDLDEVLTVNSECAMLENLKYYQCVLGDWNAAHSALVHVHSWCEVAILVCMPAQHLAYFPRCHRINCYNTDKCVTSRVVGETIIEGKMQKVNHLGVLCVCVMARWKMSLCHVSEGKHASRGRSLVPPRSLHSNTPGSSLWCAPCWEQKQSRGRQAVNDKSLKSLPFSLFLPLSFLTVLCSREKFTLTTHLIC